MSWRRWGVLGLGVVLGAGLLLLLYEQAALRGLVPSIATIAVAPPIDPTPTMPDFQSSHSVVTLMGQSDPLQPVKSTPLPPGDKPSAWQTLSVAEREAASEAQHQNWLNMTAAKRIENILEARKRRPQTDPAVLQNILAAATVAWESHTSGERKRAILRLRERIMIMPQQERDLTREDLKTIERFPPDQTRLFLLLLDEAPPPPADLPLNIPGKEVLKKYAASVLTGEPPAGYVLPPEESQRPAAPRG